MTTAPLRLCVAALSMLTAAGCSRSPRKLPPPACRAAPDCDASAMRGAQCVQGRCAFVASVSGRVRFIGKAPRGTLHVAAYPATAFFNAIGPAPRVVPVGTQQSFKNPIFPASYRLSELPNGKSIVYAFISIDDRNPSESRACSGDLVGIAPVTILAGSAVRSSVDVTVRTPVNTNILCK